MISDKASEAPVARSAPRSRRSSRGDHGDPFAVLGLHDGAGGGSWCARFLPRRRARSRLIDARVGRARRRAVARASRRLVRRPHARPHGAVPLSAAPRGRRRHASRSTIPTASRRCSASSTSICSPRAATSRLYEKLGAHPIDDRGRRGRRASRSGRRTRSGSAWSATSTAGTAGAIRCASASSAASGSCSSRASAAASVYKYEIIGPDGEPAAAQGRPARLRRRASARAPPRSSHGLGEPRLARCAPGWPRARARQRARRADLDLRGHLGSWLRVPEQGNRYLSYDELADRLMPYVDEMGFTHVELLPVTEHPFDGSWGYQPIGLFAPTSRFGTPDGFRPLRRPLPSRPASACMLDWVPAHFPTDAHGLGRFDGTALYEHADPRAGLPPRLEHADLQFRPARGRELPARQRAVLAASSTTSTACASMPSPRCSTSTTAARPASGSPTCMAAARTSRRSRFLRRLNELVYGERPGRDHDRRGIDRLAAACRGRPISAGSASATNGTWAGCTTRCDYMQRGPGPSHATTTTS